jgi:hypothetical protein
MVCAAKLWRFAELQFLVGRITMHSKFLLGIAAAALSAPLLLGGCETMQQETAATEASGMTGESEATRAANAAEESAAAALAAQEAAEAAARAAEEAAAAAQEASERADRMMQKSMEK